MANATLPDWREVRPLYPDRPDLPSDRREAMPFSDPLKAVDEALVRDPQPFLERWPDIVGFGIGVRERRLRVVDGEVVLSCFVEKKHPAARLRPSRRIDRSIEIGGMRIDTDVVEIGKIELLQNSATASPWTLARNDPAMGLDIPLDGGMQIGRLTSNEYGTLTGIFRDVGTGEHVWVTNTHVAGAGGGPMVQPHPLGVALQPHNELGTPDVMIPYVVPNPIPLPVVGSTALLLHVDAARGPLRLVAIDPPPANIPPFNHTAPRAPLGELLNAGQFGGAFPAGVGEPVRKSGARSSVTFGATITGTGNFLASAIAPFGVIPSGLSPSSLIGGVTVHRLESRHGDSGSAIVNNRTDQIEALLWGGAFGTGISFGDDIFYVLFFLGITPP